MVTRSPSQNAEAKVIRFPASTSGSELGQEFVLDQLECGVEYEVKIKTENAIGESFRELVLKANTIGSGLSVFRIKDQEYSSRFL